MTSTDEPAWSPLTGGTSGVGGIPAQPGVGIPDELVRLAGRCLAADGGLPLAADPDFLRRRWQVPRGETFALRDAGGSLLAAGAVCPGPDGPIVTGLVDPSARGRGLGARLLDHALSLAAAPPPTPADTGPAGVRAAGVGPAGVGPAGTGAAGTGAAGTGAAGTGAAGTGAAGVGPAGGGRPAVIVETESLTDAADRLFTARGLRQFFAEDVMRIDPSGVAAPTWPAGTAYVEWSADTTARFHAVYAASFRDRPGFPDPPADEWIADCAEDKDFRPGWSLLASAPDLGDVGFVTAADGWIVQVGVVPPARGRGIGEALIRESLSRMTGPEAWLTVNVNNPGAAGLYRRLGFTDQGRRARYRLGYI